MENVTYKAKSRFYFSDDTARTTFNEGDAVTGSEEQIKRALDGDLIEADKGKAPLTLDGMTKAELIEHAETNGIEIDKSANKPEVLEAIRKAGSDK